MNDVFDQLVMALKPFGLNHYGVVSVHAYDQHARPSLRSQVLSPGSRSIVVFASAGPSLWTAFLSDLAKDSGHLTEEEHPLDAFVARGLHSASRSLDGHPHRWCTASAEADVHIDFRTLAIHAGLGSASRLGLVIHPTFGPWMGLRAACFVPDIIPVSPIITDVCSGCAGPCASACPGGAFVGGMWDVGICASFHQGDSPCAQRCDARMACPVGSEQRYSALERLYHYDREAGRRALAEHIGITGDTHVGIGPHWGDWSSPSGGEDLT